MRSLGTFLGLAVFVQLAVGCAASSKELRAAKSASYTCKREDVLRAGVKVLEDKVAPVSVADPIKGVAITKHRWHDEYGKRKPMDIEANGIRRGDVLVAVQLVVKNHGADRFVLVFDSDVRGYVEGSPAAVPLGKGNAERPAWVETRADEVHVAIHNALAHCAVAPVAAPAVKP